MKKGSIQDLLLLMHLGPHIDARLNEDQGELGLPRDGNPEHDSR